MNTIPSYSTWRDKADNIGIQCAVCTRIHWTYDAPPTDPQTGALCPNCIAIKDGKYMIKETALHAEELKAYDEYLRTTKDEIKEPFKCKHEPSQ